MLYEDNGGIPKVVAYQTFQYLKVNQKIIFSYTREWSKGSPAEGEFPPRYKLVISYAPDLYTDGNRNNDDFNTLNNEFEKSGSEINSMPF